MNSNRGSMWRRWDLHLHTPDTKLSNSYKDSGDIWLKYIKCLEESDVQVFGVTDYFSADGYFSLIDRYKTEFPNSEKVFFPNIEFRLVEAISKNNSNPNIHVIFDNDPNHCSKSQIDKFLSKLSTSAVDRSGVRVSCSELQSQADFESASVSLDDLKDALISTFGDSTPYLIVFPANNDGVRSTDSKSPRKVVVSDRIDKASDIFFGNSTNKDWFLSCDRYGDGKSQPKPVISGSDAHSFSDLERLEGNVVGFEPTWIKADPSFRGLKQICFEPEYRVFIGTEPEVMLRQVAEATKFLDCLKINQVDRYDESNGVWFKNVNIPLNPELAVIIGNKGSGKSALVDIIGLLGESAQEAYFSFLSNKNPNKKFRKKGYSENFNAEINWLGGGIPIVKALNEGVSTTEPEKIRYLPQNYFEQLTNEIEIEEFRKEIENVVFSHVEETNRMGMNSFEDLQTFKTQQSQNETQILISRLNDVNEKLIDYEEQADPLYKEKLIAELNSKKLELSSLDASPPPEVEKPDQESLEQKRFSEGLVELSLVENELIAKEKSLVEELTTLKSRLQKLTTLHQRLQSMSTYIVGESAQLKPKCEELGIDFNEIYSGQINFEPVNLKVTEVSEQIALLEQDDDITFTGTVVVSSLKSLPDIRAAKLFIKESTDLLKEKLGTPQRKYQAYIEKMAFWRVRRLEVIGDEVNPNAGTINFLNEKISYIDNDVKNTIQEALDKRKLIVKSIFDSKKKVLDFYSTLKESVEFKLDSVRTADFSVEIEASFVAERKFKDELLNFIDKTRKGYFHGSNDPAARFQALVTEVNWDDFDSLYSFCEELLERLTQHEGRPVSIKDQVKNIGDLYEYLFSLEYFSPKYELRLGTKNLNELSPGEKGLLLLVFYLQLDKDSIPLVIDQPEDNLDNDSIFAVLAKCIREAKKRRQVILVTHNPNLAVGADAEQVIYVNLDKPNNYKFSYETGSIENPDINQRIVDVLEGSQPAFIKRRLKYQI